jgi:hypothetical protein
MRTDDLSSVPPFPLQIGDSDQYISGIVVLPTSLLVEITVKDVTSGQTWACGPVPAPSPLEAFGKSLNAWRASITYPIDPEPPTQTLDPQALRPYCWRYRHAFEHAKLDVETLKRFRLQLYREWEADKKHRISSHSVQMIAARARSGRVKRNGVTSTMPLSPTWRSGNKVESPIRIKSEERKVLSAHCHIAGHSLSLIGACLNASSRYTKEDSSDWYKDH